MKNLQSTKTISYEYVAKLGQINLNVKVNVKVNVSIYEWIRVM